MCTCGEFCLCLFQAEDGIRDLVRSRGLGDVYKRQGRHFFADVDPQALGHKALAVNLSDLAAMGARPLGLSLIHI